MLGNPGEAPGRSSQSRRRYRFRLFDQVHIRVGSNSPAVFAICTQITAIQLVQSPSAVHRRFPEAP